MASPETGTTDDHTNLSIQLNGHDIDSTSLTFAIVDGPTNGTLSALGNVSCTLAPNDTLTPGSTCAVVVTYTPSGHFAGDDSFTFRVNDGFANSSLATGRYAAITALTPRPWEQALSEHLAALGEAVSGDAARPGGPGRRGPL